MTVWSELSDEQQCEAIERVQRGEDRGEIATAFGLKPQSFDRKLRALREAGRISNYIRPTLTATTMGERDDQLEGSSFLIDGNEAELDWTSGTGPIRTLDALIESHEIDLSMWIQQGIVTHNTWTTPRARHGESGFEYFQNHQIKAAFIKRHPEPIFPVIQPVEVSVEAAPLPPFRTEGTGTSFVFADPHFGYRKDLKTAHLTPFHNRKALDVCLQIITLKQPDRVDILGDWLDMTEWTDKFLRDPEFYWCTQPALLESSWWLTQIRLAAPQTRIVLHQGNHDARLDNALKTHLPAAYDLKAVDELELPPALSLPKLLALHKLGVDWVGDYPNDKSWLNDAVLLEHGEKALSPGMTARAVARDAHECHVFGHIHRREMIDKTIHLREGDKSITAFCPACVCWTDGRVPANVSDKRLQWQNGAALVEYEVSGDGYSLTPIFINGNRALLNGSIIEGRDRLEEIRLSMDGWLI
jgi:hypothetical protein